MYNLPSLTCTQCTHIVSQQSEQRQMAMVYNVPQIYLDQHHLSLYLCMKGGKVRDENLITIPDSKIPKLPFLVYDEHLNPTLATHLVISRRKPTTGSRRGRISD